jgi:DNA end-binding protein Ku
MPARAMWKAELDIDELRLPVKLFAAVQDTKVHFRLLHAKDDTPVKQQMVDPATLEPVSPDEIARAVEVDRGVFVRLTKDELAAIDPEPSRAITVERVVSADKLDERWFDRPYYLGPDGDDDHAYFAVAQTLEEKAWIGIAHWAMRGKSYTGALYGSDGYLLLDTLRNAQQVVEIDALRVPASRAPDPREIKLAEQLIATLEDEFDPEAYRDEHRDKVLALLEAKAKGKVVRFPKAARRKPTDSLLKDLRASLKGGHKARRASGGR